MKESDVMMTGCRYEGVKRIGNGTTALAFRSHSQERYTIPRKKAHSWVVMQSEETGKSV